MIFSTLTVRKSMNGAFRANPSFSNLRRVFDERGYRTSTDKLELIEKMSWAAILELSAAVAIDDLPTRLVALGDYENWLVRQPPEVKREMSTPRDLLEDILSRYTLQDRKRAESIVLACRVQSLVDHVSNIALRNRLKRQQVKTLQVPMKTGLRSRDLGKERINSRAVSKWTNLDYIILRKAMQSGVLSKSEIKWRDAILRYFMRSGFRAPQIPRGLKVTYLYRGTDWKNPMLNSLGRGDAYDEASFSSFTWSTVVAEGTGSVILRLKISDITPGTPYVWFGVRNAVTLIDSESEVLMPPGRYSGLRHYFGHKEFFDVSFEPSPILGPTQNPKKRPRQSWPAPPPLPPNEKAGDVNMDLYALIEAAMGGYKL